MYNMFNGVSVKYLNDDANIEFTDLEEIGVNSGCYCVMRYRGHNTGKKHNNFPKLKKAYLGSCMYYAMGNSTFNLSSTYPQKQHIVVFPKLEEAGTANASSAMAYLLYTPAGYIKYVWFNMLNKIGYAGTTSYSNFRNAFTGTYNSEYFEVCFPELTSIISSSTSTSAAYGNFYQCTGVSKFWMPKLSSLSGAPSTTTLFNGCTQSGLEIHFGKENETYIKSLAAYSTKFGATNATIYFDCINHITVNGVVYNRDGEHYITECPVRETSSSPITHPDDRYSWKDANGNIVYTLECWTPAVGDNVLDASDNVIGTISAVS